MSHVRFGSGGGASDCPTDHNLGGAPLARASALAAITMSAPVKPTATATRITENHYVASILFTLRTSRVQNTADE
jgi:hypothetical protein